MAFPKKLKELCTPAFIYFLLSVIGILVTVVTNLTSKSNMYTLGNFCCPVPHKGLVFIVKIIYILFWTWILNLMCKDGHREIAWFLVLLPFILYFWVLVMMKKPGFEGFEDGVVVEEEEEEEKIEGFKNPEEEDEEEEAMEPFTTNKTNMGLPVPNGY